VAHNAQFDIRMLDQEIERLDAVDPWTVYIKCTLGMVRRDYTRSLKLDLDIFSPLKQKTFKSVSYAERQKQRREKEALKIKKAWEREQRYAKKVQSSSQEEARDKRAEKRSKLKRSRYDSENQENVSPNSQTRGFDGSNFRSPKRKKKKKTSSRPSFKLSSVLGRLDTSPRRAVKKHGHSLPKICEEHGVPEVRWDFHDALWDTGGLVGLVDHLSSSSDSSQPSSQEKDEEKNPFVFHEEEELDIFLLDEEDTKEDNPFVIHSSF